MWSILKSPIYPPPRLLFPSPVRQESSPALGDIFKAAHEVKLLQSRLCVQQINAILSRVSF